MPTNFPTSLDNFTNPTSTDNLNTAGVLHDEQHANVNDAIEAIEAYLLATGREYDVNRAPYNAVPARYYTDGVTTAASTTFTSASANFTAGDVGKHICIIHGGASIDQSRTATITAVTNSTTITLSNTAGRSETGAPFYVGSSQQTAIQAACDAAAAAGGGTVLLPGVGYFIDGLTLGNRVNVRGMGMRATMLILTVSRDTPVLTTRVATTAVQGVTVTAGGSGYSNTPFAVSFSGGGGTGAAGLAYTNGSGVITRVVMTNSGSGYTSAPTVSFGAGGATGTAVLGLGEAQLIGLYDLTINGSRDRQQGNSGVAHGMWNNTLNQVAGRLDDMEFGDAHFYAARVEFYNCKNNGYHGEQKAETKIIGCQAYYCDGYGFKTGYDALMVGCTAAVSGLAGFYIGASTAVVGCKSWLNGGVTPASGHGFVFDGINFGNSVLSGCVAQDNKAAGLYLNNCKSVMVSGFTADSNGTRGTYAAPTDPAIILVDTSYCRIEAHSIEREQSGQGTGTQRYGIRMTGTCDGNVIRMTHRGLNAANPGGGFTYDTAAAPLDPASASGAIVGNTLEFNNQVGIQQPAYVTPFAPDPYIGGIIDLTLTGNITINDVLTGTINAQTFTHKHYGATLIFNFKQDATGGRTTTWNATAYNSLVWQPNAAPNSRSAVTFMFDGTSWQIVSQDVDKAVNAARWHESIVKTNVNTTYVTVYTGLNGQRQLVNFTGYSQCRLLIHISNNEATTTSVRVIENGTPANLLTTELVTAATTGEKELDSGWVTLPAWAIGDKFLEPQIKAGTATADPTFRALAVYMR